MTKKPLIFALAGLALSAQIATAHSAPVITTFDDLPLAAESHYFPEKEASFSSGLATFQHSYDTDYGSWDNFTYSNRTDTVAAGFGNQFSAYTGVGFGGSANYGISYESTFKGVAPAISFAAPTVVAGAYFTNTTYAALSMINGDSFAKKFGGDSGNDADWFKLVITGVDANGATAGTLDFFLADYRFTDNSQDYIVNTWNYVDFSSFGAVTSLKFNMQSSDVGQYGINTPTYFAIDHLTASIAAVPEPSSYALLLAGLALVGLVSRKRQQ